MVEKAEVKADSLLNLDDLLQCPVCYEIPTGQIFQCNEGHHVCGRCKTRLDVCPVCRALFFGTRNYAMEELIANFRKFKSMKADEATAAVSETGGVIAVVTDTTSTDSADLENEVNDSDDSDSDTSDSDDDVEAFVIRINPQSSKGLFRCLCCKIGHNQRLPVARLLNHLRFHHRSNLVEGRSENGEYIQAWQIATTPGRIQTAIRILHIGIFFLTIEITNDSVFSWLAMAASPWISHAYNYSITISGSDREAIFSDSVPSVRSCEGTLRKRGQCLLVKDVNAQAMCASESMNAKICIRRTPEDQIHIQSQPRAVLRIANRVNNDNVSQNFLQDFDNVTRLTESLATLNREADEIENQLIIVNEMNRRNQEVAGPVENNDVDVEYPAMSRNARRRMRQRVRAALNGPPDERMESSRINVLQRHIQEIREVFATDGIFSHVAPQAQRVFPIASPPIRPAHVPPVQNGVFPPPRSARSGIFPPPQARSRVVIPRTGRAARPHPSIPSPFVVMLPEQFSPIASPPVVSSLVPSAPRREPQHGSSLVDPRNSSDVSRPTSSSAPPPAASGNSNGHVDNGNGTRTQKRRRRRQRR